jgi:hypothetical protein
MDYLRFSFENIFALWREAPRSTLDENPSDGSGYTDSINPIEILYIFSREIAIPSPRSENFRFAHGCPVPIVEKVFEVDPISLSS